MNTMSNELKVANSKECDACKKSYGSFGILIGVYKQDIDEKGLGVSVKERVFICPECFEKLDKSPIGAGIVTENGLEPKGV